MTARNDSPWFLMVAGVFTAFNLAHLVAWRFGTYVHMGIYPLLLLAVFILTGKSQRLSVLLIVAVATIFVLLILQYPVTGWDARSIWFYHAKQIFFGENLYAQFEKYPTWNHNDYPTLVPAMAASMAKSVGYWNEIIPRTVVVAGYTPAFFLAAYIFRSFGFLCLWIAMVLWVCHGNMLDGYMDALVAVYFSLTCVLIACLYQAKGNADPNEHPAEIGQLWFAMAACLFHLLFLKNEGLILSAIALLILSPVLLKRVGLVWIPGLAIGIYFVMWRYPLMQANITTDLISHGSLFERGIARLNSPKDWQSIVDALRHHTGMVHKGFFALLFMILLGWRWLKGLAPAALAPSLYVAVIFLVYLTTYQDLAWHLATSADRVVLPFNAAISGLLLYGLLVGWTALMPQQAAPPLSTSAPRANA